MKKTVLRLSVLSAALVASFGACAIDAFEPTTNRLTMESVSVGAQNYKAVAVTLGAFSVVSVGSGTPAADTFDPATSILSLGAVAYQGATYNNVQVRVNAYNILNVAANSTYAGEQAVAFNLINAERNTCGFGLLAQDASLDGAALAHASYLSVSAVTGEDAHGEVAGRAGFTGVSPTNRAVAKGYVGIAGEVVGLGTGTTAVRTLLSAPYHLNALMDGFRDVGVGIAATSIPDYLSFVVNVGIKTGVSLQQLGGSDVVTYPCNGVTGVNFQLRGETPSPIPDRNLSAFPIGTPILIKVRDGNLLTITNAAMVNAATGAPVVLRAPVSAATDPNKILKVSEAFIAPDAPLSRGTDYQVTITGLNNGVAFSRTFKFTTGTGVN